MKLEHEPNETYKMKAAVCREHGKPLSIEELKLRPPCGSEVEVEIKVCAICHSDIHYIEGAWPGDLPAVYGHEAVGTVSTVGPVVEGFKTGDRVLVTLIRSCGKCSHCAEGAPVHCSYQEVLGGNSPLRTLGGDTVIQGLSTAAFAERVVVDQSQTIKIPEDIPMESAALLSCGVITGAGAAINTAKIRPGSSVAVVGVGGVGLNAVQGARICGATKIIAIDLSEDRLSSAMEFGATHGVLATGPKHYREVREITGGPGVDYALIAVGLAAACESAWKFLAPRGELVIVGMPSSGEMASFEPLNIAFKGQSMKGSAMGDTILARDVPFLIDMYRSGQLKLDELVTKRFDLEQINDAIADTLAGNARRNVIVF